MKVLLIQEAYSSKRFEFSESLALQYNFKKLGIEAEVWGPGFDLFKRPFDEVSRGINLLFVVQNYFGHWMPDLSKLSHVYKVFWSIDSHILPEAHHEFCRQNKIDLVLNAIESHSRYFGFIETLWFPNAYHHHLIKPMKEIGKIYDLGFCGSNRSPKKGPFWWMLSKEYLKALRARSKPDRLALKWIERSYWLHYLEKECGLRKDTGVVGTGMVEAINSYRIHFNRNLFDDVNYRTYETLGCKTLLFTNRTENLDQLFDIDRHLVVYSNKKDFVEKFNYFINRPLEIEAMAERGYRHAIANHTYANRVETLLETLKIKI